MFPTYVPVPTVASDPFVMAIDLVAVMLLLVLLGNKAIRQASDIFGVAYAIMLLGFFGSFWWVAERYFNGRIPVMQFALWSLKDIGVVIGLLGLIRRNLFK